MLPAVAELYLDLMEGCLTRALFPDGTVTGDLSFTNRFDADERRDGRDWPAQAETMVGQKRLANIRYCVTDILQRGVPGDLVETGVWRGGAAIFMRAILAAYNDPRRRVWCADSFQGLPKPDPDNYPADAGDVHWTLSPYLKVPIESVQANFRRYRLLDDRVEFLAGWFKDTLPAAPIRQIAVLRVDADMYESTMQVLTHLYPKVSSGGFIIIDDYGAVPNCKEAVNDFRLDRAITEPLEPIDWTGVFWKKGDAP